MTDEFDPEEALDLTGDRDGADLHGDGLADAGDGETTRAGEGTDAATGTDDAEDGDGGEEIEPVEVLVELAREGEIDPWDIDVVHVTERFLERLDRSDLRASGRALFYASVLVRMKADALLADDEEEAPEPEPWETPLPDGPGERPPGEGAAGSAGDPTVDPVDGLEREMERRLERKRARGTPETLDELVRELREAEREEWWKESRTYDTSDSPSGYDRGPQTVDYRAGDEFREDHEPTEADVTGTAHAEDIETVVADVAAAVDEHYENGRREVLYREVREAGGSPVETYLGLLFLSNRGEVDLHQDDLFGDLWVRDPEAVPVDEAEGEGATAD
jgi:segregation and condensation protein A